MLNYVSDFLTYFKEECLGLKQLEVEHYPFDRTMRDLLPDAYSPFFALRFSRDIAESHNLSLTEVEIIMFLISERECVSFDEIVNVIDHVSEEHVSKLLRELHKKDHVYKIQDDSGDVKYGVMLEMRDDIRSYYKD
jgi:hypothetical protein